LAKIGYTNVDPAPSTSSDRAGADTPAQHKIAAAIREALVGRRMQRLRTIGCIKMSDSLLHSPPISHHQ
jgi:hypothetical protein